MIADANLEPVLSELLYYFERDEARHVGLQELLFPTRPQPGWQRALMSALGTAADKTDRWLANRAPG